MNEIHVWTIIGKQLEFISPHLFLEKFFEKYIFLQFFYLEKILIDTKKIALFCYFFKLPPINNNKTRFRFYF